MSRKIQIPFPEGKLCDAFDYSCAGIYPGPLAHACSIGNSLLKQHSGVTDFIPKIGIDRLAPAARRALREVEERKRARQELLPTQADSLSVNSGQPQHYASITNLLLTHYTFNTRSLALSLALKIT